MDVEIWCIQNDLTKAKYYYRLRRVCEVYLEQVQETAASAFVEVSVPSAASSESQKISKSVASDDTVSVIRIRNTKGLSAEMLYHLIETFSHVRWRICFRVQKSIPRYGFMDLRRGIDGLATIVRFQFKLDSYVKNTLFLFCGRRADRIKALFWEGDRFLLMYKRLDNGAFRWPSSADEAMSITEVQCRMLMQGLEIVARHPIEELKEAPGIM